MAAMAAAGAEGSHKPGASPTLQQIIIPLYQKSMLKNTQQTQAKCERVMSLAWQTQQERKLKPLPIYKTLFRMPHNVPFETSCPNLANPDSHVLGLCLGYTYLTPLHWGLDKTLIFR